jgi:hypothetical protein
LFQTDGAQRAATTIAGVGRRFVVEWITIRRFRMSAPKAGNGFVGLENCFAANGRTKQSLRKLRDFNGYRTAMGPMDQPVVHWPIAVLVPGAAVGIGYLQPPVQNSVRLFNLSLVKRPPGSRSTVNRSHGSAD